MKTYEMEDQNGMPLRFEGRELAFESSQTQAPPKDRWTELRVLKTKAGRYVLEITGQTVVEGELVRSHARVLDTAEDLITALKKRDDETGTSYLTYVAREALYAAMAHDPELERAWAALTEDVA